ncbi:MAG TPA: hypothetical protein VFN10_06625 [Thermoanaerobaculia bacterium]|nr:hypothetical protein [Thermoanaerobaculia bacterium]
MSRSIAISFLLTVVVSMRAAALDSPPFPAGTSQFFQTYAISAVPAQDGGVWIALPDGIAHYTAAGPGTVLAVPGGTPYRLRLAADGSLWFATSTIVARMTTTGTVVEQYAIADASFTVASDGAIWYVRASGSIVGRIVGGTPVEWPSPATNVSSIAPAPAGDVWLLGSGFGSAPDVLHRMTPAGAVTVIPLNADVLYGRLQSLPDGTLYIGTGYRESLLRLAPGASSVEAVPHFHDERFLVDAHENIWSATLAQLTYLAANRVSSFTIPLPYDPRSCANVPVWGYALLAVDSSGGLWLRVVDDGFYFPEAPPCDEPVPPEMPTLVRIDTAALLTLHGFGGIPTLTPSMLVALAAIIVATAMSRLRG